MNNSPENEKLLITHSALCPWGLKTKLMCSQAKVSPFIHKHECRQGLRGSRTTTDLVFKEKQKKEIKKRLINELKQPL